MYFHKVCVMFKNNINQLRDRNKMKKLGNNDIIEIANVKLMNGYSETRVCDWVFEMCDNDKRALILLRHILDSDVVLLDY